MGREPLSQIICPYCNKSIDLDEALLGPLEQRLRGQVEEEIVTKTSKSFTMKLKDLEEQLKEKEELLVKTQEEELRLRKDRRQLEEDKRSFELEMQRQLDEQRSKVLEEAVKKVSEEHHLKDQEKEKTIGDLKKRVEELSQRLEQGSQKNQGEVLELEIERLLRQQFFSDLIEPVASGARGADILQRVCLRNGQPCGTILLESKNARNWSNSWIAKLREDQRDAKADLAVLVTTVFPEGESHLMMMENVFVVHYQMVLPLVCILRNQLFEVARMKNLNLDMNEKKQLLYSYLTGVEFRQQLESIVESFAGMMQDLQKEKRSYQKIWSRREKQIETAFMGLASVYGGMQGIVGASLPELRGLSLPELTEPVGLEIESEGV